MAKIKHIALVGDYSPEILAHVAIPKALDIASRHTGCPIDYVWVATTEMEKSTDALQGFDAVWCVPASPYASMDGALNAIRQARENWLPFLGTCGGYQHAVLEFARNVLGVSEADNGEVNPDAELPLIAPLTCALVEQGGEVKFAEGSEIAKLYAQTGVTETYHCSYGIAPEYFGLFEGAALHITGFDLAGEPRAFELQAHPFYIGTAYQPERSSLSGAEHPLINAFVRAAAGKLSLVG